MKKILMMFAALGVILIATPNYAQAIGPNGETKEGSQIMNEAMQKFQSEAKTWAAKITPAANRLFWYLALFSLVWTFGIMALQRAEFGEIVVELVRFVMVTGFFFWLLTNATGGDGLVMKIINGMIQLGQTAGGVADASPSGLIDLGLQIINKAINKISFFKPIQSLSVAVAAILILVITAAIAANYIVLMVAAYVVSYAGVFVLGLGGARWTSDIAINYYKTVLGLALQLMTFILIIGIGNAILHDYLNNMANYGTPPKELVEYFKVLVITLLIYVVSNKAPPIVGGLVGGGGGSQVSSLGAGTIIGSAMTAASVASGGAAAAGRAAMQTAGVGKALNTGYQHARQDGASRMGAMGKSVGATASATSSAIQKSLKEEADRTFGGKMSAGMSANRDREKNAVDWSKMSSKK